MISWREVSVWRDYLSADGFAAAMTWCWSGTVTQEQEQEQQQSQEGLLPVWW
jgi:hypothetical protein